MEQLMDHFYETRTWQITIGFQPAMPLRGRSLKHSEIFALQKQPTNSKKLLNLWGKKELVDNRIMILWLSIIIWQCFKIISNFHRMNSLRFENSQLVKIQAILLIWLSQNSEREQRIWFVNSRVWLRGENLLFSL